MSDTVGVAPFDIEEIDLGREGDARREVGLDADRRGVAGSPRGGVGVGDARVRLGLALGDRGLAEVLDRPGGQWGLIAGKHGRGPGLGQGPVDGEDERPGVAGDRGRDAVVDADAEDATIPVDDGDDGVIVGVGGGRLVRGVG